jgi:hypothetical protein
LNFGIDFLKLFISIIATINPDKTWDVLQTPRSPSMVEQSDAPYVEIQVLRAILLAIENVVFETIFFAIRFVRFLIIMLDTFLCNIFNDFKNCAAMKTCYAFTTATVRACDALFKICLNVNLDFSKICYDMKLYRSSCTKCDRAVYTDPLGIMVKLFSDAGAYNCISIKNDPIYNNIVNCPEFKWDRNTPQFSRYINGKCVCTGSLFNSYFPSSVWVPCIPEQKECKTDSSIIPFFFDLVGGLGKPKAST